MNFDRSFLNIISEAIQSSKLQKLLNDVKAQYNKEQTKARHLKHKLWRYNLA